MTNIEKLAEKMKRVDGKIEVVEARRSAFTAIFERYPRLRDEWKGGLKQDIRTMNGVESASTNGECMIIKLTEPEDEERLAQKLAEDTYALNLTR